MADTYAAGEWLVCLKCDSKFLLQYIEGKGQNCCPMCSKPGLRIYDPLKPYFKDGPIWPGRQE